MTKRLLPAFRYSVTAATAAASVVTDICSTDNDQVYAVSCTPRTKSAICHLRLLPCFVGCSGAEKLDIELDKITIDQCTDSNDAFANTHRCQHSTFVGFRVVCLLFTLLSVIVVLSKPRMFLFSSFLTCT